MSAARVWLFRGALVVVVGSRRHHRHRGRLLAVAPAAGGAAVDVHARVFARYATPVPATGGAVR